MEKLGNFSGVKVFYKSTAIPKERVSVATKLEPNTFKRLINNLTLSGFFQLIVRNKIE